MTKYFLAKILTLLGRAYVKRYKPQIIAITGNVGKTSTKEMVAAVLMSPFRNCISLRRSPFWDFWDRRSTRCGSMSASGRKIRVSGGNLNNDIGVPLTILGDWTEQYYDQGGTVFFWLKVLLSSFAGLFVRDENYPEILVMEYGADRPGDIAKLSKNFKPNFAVVTAIGDIPVHIEYFSSPNEVVAEKSKLVEVLGAEDFAILNFDDQAVLDIKQKTRAKVLTFGFGEGAGIRASNFDFRKGANNEPLGVGFKLHYGDSFVPVKIDGALGKSQVWAAGAAVAIGLSFGMNPIFISEALSNYRAPSGRLKILKGVKNSWIIDDTYNASPASTRLALETLKILPAPRKIAVLADMLELGQYSMGAHQDAGNFAGTFVDVLITVGSGGKIIADAAGNQISKDQIISFDTAKEAKTKVQEILIPGDLVLVKGSQGMRMERVVEEIMAEPERKKELLVRQSKKWLNKV